jgi:hypothetical protein
VAAPHRPSRRRAASLAERELDPRQLPETGTAELRATHPADDAALR